MSEYNFNAKKVKDDLIKWLQNWFEINGKGCKAVVGISGGIDSSIVSALCVEALGKDRVVGVLMPNGEQKDINDALNVVNYLNIKYHVINIHDAVFAVKNEVEAALGNELSLQSSINLPPRVRMSSLYAISQSVNGRVANTSNLSESYVGFDTRYGDSVGDFAPLFNLTKTEIRQIAKELNLPDEIVNKTPADGLTGKSDEENFGFTYEVLDKYIRTGIIEDLESKKKIDERHKKNLFKLNPMPSFPYGSEFISKNNMIKLANTNEEVDVNVLVQMFDDFINAGSKNTAEVIKRLVANGTSTREEVIELCDMIIASCKKKTS